MIEIQQIRLTFTNLYSWGSSAFSYNSCAWCRMKVRFRKWRNAWCSSIDFSCYVALEPYANLSDSEMFMMLQTNKYCLQLVRYLQQFFQHARGVWKERMLRCEYLSDFTLKTSLSSSKVKNCKYHCNSPMLWYIYILFNNRSFISI